VLRDAYLISHFQTGLKNVLDRAVLEIQGTAHELGIDKYKMVDEIPFDFSRRMMSVAIERSERRAAIAHQGRAGSGLRQMQPLRERRRNFPDGADSHRRSGQQVNSLSEDGFRVLAVATKKTWDRKPPSPKPTKAIWF
jgi:Mg2+-importing ATPase